MNTVLEITNLTKKFSRITAVDNISFAVEKGNVYGLLGPNGSGKSTTLGLLLTTINPTAGSWKWFGEEKTTTNVLKRIGAIIEHPNFYSYLSARKNLKIVCTIKGIDYSRIDEVLKLVGLEERKNDAFKTYSLGMKQRMAIASAMISNPEVLILDEPTNGLDPEGIIQVRNIIKKIATSGTTILLASHLLDEVEKVCSHVIIMKKGKSLYTGEVSKMSTNKGYYELVSSDLNKLAEIVSQNFNFDKVKIKDNAVFAYLKEDVDQESFVKKLYDNGVILTKIIHHKSKLEDQFLRLVK